MKIGRNQSCPCGSGKKHKRCHGAAAKADPLPPGFDNHMRKMIEKHQADERIRTRQQGFGKPIISAKFDGQQMVAVRNKLFYSPEWKTVPDFLGAYIKNAIGADWGNAELKKPLGERHPILQWYDAYCAYQKETVKNPGEISEAAINGVVACYMGLAYSLYLIDHNVELQRRLVKRLRNVGNFQGAYYELIVANILIRAGFELELEDESNGQSRHCEFSAVSKKTGKKYWVEAKMRSVAGYLGKNNKDGTTEENPVSRLIPHLHDALDKPAADERFIFIDLNSDLEIDGTTGLPVWGDRATALLKEYEENSPGKKAYVFVTDMPFHRFLDGSTKTAMRPYGLGIPDFNNEGPMKLSEMYRQRQRHIDAYDIGAAFQKYLAFPSTFDGSLPSEAFSGKSSRLVVGETYIFGAGNEAQLGTVTSATVSEWDKHMVAGVSLKDGRNVIMRQPMTEAEFSDYLAHPDAYFGRVQTSQRNTDDPYEFFERLLESNKHTPREVMLNWFKESKDFENLTQMNDEDLRIEYCERIVCAILARAKSKAA